MKLTSSAFRDHEIIPSRYTCEGQNVNPPLEISGVPPEAKSLVLLVDDPDVPKHLRPDGMWDHWVLFNINPQTTAIAENSVPRGALHGKNTGGKNAYGGPCPPDREHRYYFKLYALDTRLELGEGATKAELEAAMQGHILTEGVLMGKYIRKR